MTVKARFDGKAFVPDEPVNLPQGAAVTIVVVSNGEGPLADLVKLAREHPIQDSPADWSERHDHYIHGTPDS